MALLLVAVSYGCKTIDALDKAASRSLYQSMGITPPDEAASDGQGDAGQTAAAPAEQLTVNKEFQSVKIWSEPSTNSQIVCKVPGGSQVAKLAENDEWYQVRTQDNNSGWISKRAIKTDDQ